MRLIFEAHSSLLSWWTLQNIRALTEVLAYLAALVFFIYKIGAGYLVTELSLQVTCERAPAEDAGQDYLSIKATLKKGLQQGTLRLHDAQVRITEVQNNPPSPTVLDLIGVERLSYQSDCSKWPEEVRSKINWETSKSKPFLNMAPGDESQFSCNCQVSRFAPAVIEVAILGKRLLSCKRGQWRSSIVSLPSTGKK